MPRCSGAEAGPPVKTFKKNKEFRLEQLIENHLRQSIEVEILRTRGIVFRREGNKKFRLEQLVENHLRQSIEAKTFFKKLYEKLDALRALFVKPSCNALV